MDATAILLANLAEIYDQLRKLRDTAGLTEDETRAVDELLAEIDELPERPAGEHRRHRVPRQRGQSPQADARSEGGHAP